MTLYLKKHFANTGLPAHIRIHGPEKTDAYLTPRCWGVKTRPGHTSANSVAGIYPPGNDHISPTQKSRHFWVDSFLAFPFGCDILMLVSGGYSSSPKTKLRYMIPWCWRSLNSSFSKKEFPSFTWQGFTKKWHLTKTTHLPSPSFSILYPSFWTL